VVSLRFEQRPGEPFARVGCTVRFDDCDAVLTFTDETIAADLTAWLVAHERAALTAYPNPKENAMPDDNPPGFPLPYFRPDFAKQPRSKPAIGLCSHWDCGRPPVTQSPNPQHPHCLKAWCGIHQPR
jgi:hypothetical protein